MKLFDKTYTDVENALLDGIGVCAMSADGDGNICINQIVNKSDYSVIGWNIALGISYKNSIEEFGDIVVLYETHDTDLDSIRRVVEIFLSLAKPKTIELI